MSTELKNLITKINDRNLQKRRESGLTFYALLVVIATTIIYSLETLFIVLEGSPKTYLITSIIINVCLIATYLHNAFITNNRIGLRVMSNLDWEKLKYNSTGIALACFLAIFINLLFLEYIESKILFSYYFIINIAIYSLLFIAGTLGVTLKTKKIGRNYNQIFYDNEILLAKNKPTKDLTWITVTLILFLPLILPIFFIFPIEFTVEESRMIPFAIKLGCSLFALFFSIISFYRFLGQREQYIWVEKLEIDLYLKELETNEIKQRLLQYYYGAPFIDWFKRHENMLLVELNKYKQALEEINDDYSKYNAIDTQYSHERKIRQKKLLKKCKCVLNDHQPYLDGIKSNIVKILTKSYLGEEEKMAMENCNQEIQTVLIETEKQIQKIRTELITLPNTRTSTIAG